MYITFIPNRDKKLIPPYTSPLVGVAGFSHNQIGILNRIPFIAKYCNRVAIFPSPYLILGVYHNNNGKLCKNRKWEDYYDISKIFNVDFSEPFLFNEDGTIDTSKSVEYVPADINLNELKAKTSEIIVLVLYNKPNSNLYYYSFLPNVTQNNIDFQPSRLLLDIVSRFQLPDLYTFLHIRRGDMLHNKSLAPPVGTHTYTDKTFICYVINNIIKNDIVIISTNEKEKEYIDFITHNTSKVIIFESDLYQYLSDDVMNDNYMIYQIMHTLALQSNENIGSISSYVRLGSKYHHCLDRLYIVTKQNIVLS